MSKAFTKEDTDDAPVAVPRRMPLPPGTPNYVTPGGLAAYQTELAALKQERAQLLAAPAGIETSGRAAQLAARLAELEARLASAEVVDATGSPRDRVRFGASVRVRHASGAERVVSLVGVDEADAGQGRVAFVAPLARALLGRSVGDVIELSTPQGEDELELLAIDYE